MSLDFELSNDDGPSQHINYADLDALGPNKFVALSAEEWNQFKDSLTDLYLNQNWTARKLNEMMRDAGYQTTHKMILNHLNKWGIRRYQTSKEKEELCRQLLDDHTSGRQMPSLDNKLLKKLQRYCKEKPEQSDSDKIFLNLLQDLEITPAISSDGPSDEVSTENQNNSMDVDQPHMANTSSHDSMFPRAPTSQSYSQFEYGTSSSSDIVSELAGQVDKDNIRDNPTDTDSDKLLTYMPDPIIRQPVHVNSKFKSMQWLCDLSQRYYHVKLQEHLLCLQGFNSGVHDRSSESESFINTLSQNRLFWTKVKSGIYYLKMGSDHLARPELAEAFQMIPLLCERQPFSLLKDIYATISPVATRVRPTLRIELLRTLKQNAVTRLGPNHVLSEICRILCTEEGSDELSITALQAMLDETKKILPPEHPELFELQRTLTRLYRRNREFSIAEELGWSLIESSESLHGKNHVNSRLALSEYVYVLSDQDRYDEALNIAEDVLHRGQLELGYAFPDERSIYAMEDVAEICEKLERINDSIDWLRRASRAALSVWGNQTATVHIWDKLEAMHDKRYRQIVYTDVP